MAASAPPRPRAVVAMSGGVDSAVAAAQMVEAGYDVVGITLQLYDAGAVRGRAGTCCAGRDIADARRAAEALGIPHYVLDYERRFREAVIDDFAASYAAGETPVPCVRCNQSVKFRDLLTATRELGAEVLATGHYVRRVDGPGGPELHRAADSARDQSYFLFATTAEQLRFLRFPLGTMRKAETRAAARRYRIPVAEKPDSQDICFVTGGRYSDVVRRVLPGAEVTGDIVHVDGRVLGRHRGLIHFTVGQRRGLGLGFGQPLYVLRLEPGSARLVVGPRDALGVRRFRVRAWNGLSDPLPVEGVRAAVRVRSTRPAVPATLFARAGGGAGVVLDAAEEGVAPGQGCVAYDGTRVLGGGWIERVPAAAEVPPASAAA